MVKETNSDERSLRNVVEDIKKKDKELENGLKDEVKAAKDLSRELLKRD